MLIPNAYDSPPESYKSYKNRTIGKLTERAKNLKNAVKDCSLKGEDKQKLIQDSINLFNEIAL